MNKYVVLQCNKIVDDEGVATDEGFLVAFRSSKVEAEKVAREQAVYCDEGEYIVCAVVIATVGLKPEDA